ncbi:MAG: PQQ-binding-like beta-propeller repeat protein [Candidatus Thermoplasmatota archaeon]
MTVRAVGLATLAVALLGVAAVVQGLPLAQLDFGQPTPVASALQAPGAPASPVADALSGVRHVLDAVRAGGLDPQGPGAPEGLRALDALVQMQNGTNSTQLPGMNGTRSHHHGDLGDQGLAPVWAAVFHGVPRISDAGDLDGDGVIDAVVGSDLSVSAFSGATGDLLWADHIGSAIVALRVLPQDGRVLYATSWEAQTPRVVMLQAETGQLVWQHIGEVAYLTATPQRDAAGSDVLAVDAMGRHSLLAFADGSELRSTATDLLPNTGAIVAGAYNFGHYLATAGDLTGDGVTDTVSVALNLVFVFGVQVYVFDVYATVHAVDGATGEVLWRHFYGVEPLPGFRLSAIVAIGLVDAQGDGSLDVSYSGFTYDFVQNVPVPLVETHLRVLQGSATAVAPIIATRSFVTPLLQLELITDLDRTDVQGDGPEELAVMRYSLVAGLLSGTSSTYERYTLPTGAQGSQTMLVLSDVAFSIGESIKGFDADGDGRREHALMGTTGHWALVAPDGTLTADVEPLDVTVLTMVPMGDRIGLATLGEFQLHSTATPVDVATRYFLRGSPLEFQVADRDGDGTDDLYVLSTDHNLHVLDGLTGLVQATVELGSLTRSLRVADVTGDQRPDVLVQRRTEVDGSLTYALQALDALDGNVVYTTATVGTSLAGGKPGWLDGNGDGVPDLVPSWILTSSSSGSGLAGKLTAVSGRDGTTLWEGEQSIEDVYPYWDRMVAANLDGGPGEDLVLVDWSNGALALDGATGKRLWWIGWDDYYYNGCVGRVDADGDGTDSVLLVTTDYQDPVVQLITAGKSANVKMIDDARYIYACKIVPVSDAEGRDDVLFSASYSDEDYDVQGGIQRLSFASGNAEIVWSEMSQRSDIEADALFALGADGGAPDGGRVYSAWQDHVFVTRWTNGSLVGEFAINGPFVEAGLAMDLDGRTPAEAVVLGGDGLLWALSENAGVVRDRLAEEAAEQGKADAFGPDVSRGKKSNGIPALGLPMLAAGAAMAVALRRRMQG